MKISNSKKELACIISEHGGWRNGEFAAQDGDGGVGGYDVKPEWSLLGKYWRNEARGEWFLVNKIENHHQTVLSRDEYFHLYPAADAKPEFCESVMGSIPEPIAKPTIEQLAADYRNAKDYADRKQQEADAAKADADAKLAELIDAGKALGLVLGVIAQESELVITDWRDLRVGDVIELTGSLNPCWQEHAGIEMTVNAVYHDQGDDDDQVDLLGESGTWSLGGNTDWRFIRRP